MILSTEVINGKVTAPTCPKHSSPLSIVNCTDLRAGCGTTFSYQIVLDGRRGVSELAREDQISHMIVHASQSVGLGDTSLVVQGFRIGRAWDFGPYFPSAHIS
jgi:hypothetical protein